MGTNILKNRKESSGYQSEKLDTYSFDKNS